MNVKIWVCARSRRSVKRDRLTIIHELAAYIPHSQNVLSLFIYSKKVVSQSIIRKRRRLGRHDQTASATYAQPRKKKLCHHWWSPWATWSVVGFFLRERLKKIERIKGGNQGRRGIIEAVNHHHRALTRSRYYTAFGCLQQWCNSCGRALFLSTLLCWFARDGLLNHWWNSWLYLTRSQPELMLGEWGRESRR